MKEQLEKELTNNLSGPLLFNYVWWLLRQAQSQKIDVLFFLARDGYLLRKIAERFCETFGLNIECKYLYCSRASLRMPTYHLIGDEAYDLLLLGGYHVTLRSLLQRAEMDETQRKAVYEDCGLQGADEERCLNREEMRDIRRRLRQSSVYRTCIYEKSEKAYPAAVGYFRQEGLFDAPRVALVDSGWTGSMQRSLRQLLQSQGFRGELTGFYFGMYAEPKAAEDGVYQTWYFDHASSPAVKIPFCNNLFECLLSAPHGMTTGYAKQSEKYVPIMLPAPERAELERIQNHIDDMLQYVNDLLSRTDFDSFDAAAGWKDSRIRINRYMAHPTREEVSYYGQFLFCDDTTEAYHFHLADGGQIKALKGHSIPARIWRRFFRRRSKAVSELFWPFGTIALLPRWKQLWYRLNVYAWEWIRYVLH